MEWLKWLVGKLIGSNAKDYRSMQEFYQQAILDLKKELEEHKQKIVQSYEDQKKIIESHRVRHPDNGIELDEWHDREHDRMLELVRAKEEIYYWKEKALFHEKENERLLLRLEKNNFKQ